jgi:hypothetical protein
VKSTQITFPMGESLGSRLNKQQHCETFWRDLLHFEQGRDSDLRVTSVIDAFFLGEPRARTKWQKRDGSRGIDDPDIALKQHPEYLRALIRRAQLRAAVDDLDGSISD